MVNCINTDNKNHSCSKLNLGYYRPPNEYQFENYNMRVENIDSIVLHYTVSDYARSFYLLGHGDGLRTNVSAHYLVSKEGRIDSLVDDCNVAWHAGISYWRGKDSLNSRSIGIEIVNPGSGEDKCFPIGNQSTCIANECDYHPFQDAQIASVINLVKCLKVQYQIDDKNIIGHSDIAANRKIDPGVSFPWEYLYKEGIGIYSSKNPIPNNVIYKYGTNDTQILELKNSLEKVGYKVDNSTIFDLNLSYVVRAFHFHYSHIDKNQSWDDWSSRDQERLDDLILYPTLLNQNHLDIEIPKEEI